jgi:hypothetical protein
VARPGAERARVTELIERQPAEGLLGEVAAAW